MHVLAVDDDAMFRRLFLKIPEMGIVDGLECQSIGCGAEALEICKERLPDVLILDWVMDGTDGLEVARELRRLHGKVPYILMCTSMTRDEDLKLALDAGVDDYLKKPFDLSDLAARMRIAETRLKRGREHDQAARDVQRFERLEAMATLANGVAHDFNNILGPILAYSQMIQRQFQDGDPNYRRLDAILRSCRRGTDLVRQIMTYAAIDRMKREQFTIGSLVSSFTNKVSDSEMPMPVHFAVKEAETSIKGSTHLLSEALVNVYSNALKAVSGDSERVKISIAYAERNGARFIRICVEDDGNGIAEDHRNHIFEPFYSTEERTKGTGMGLAVVDGVVRAHHGIISVETEENEGTTFEILLPLRTRRADLTTTKPVVTSKLDKVQIG